MQAAMFQIDEKDAFNHHYKTVTTTTKATTTMTTMMTDI
jgi:hypothetical protein